jgi:acid phosphatase (class A)
VSGRAPFLRLFVLLVLAASAACSAPAVFVAPGQVDLTLLLAPPPAAGSEAQARDLQAVLEMQRSTTPEDIARARADNAPGLAGFAAVLGPDFSTERLPKTAALLGQVGRDVSRAIAEAKDHWQRPRPYVVAPEIAPLVSVGSDSYPSGHAAFGCAGAIVLAEMVPERRAELFARGRDYGRSRIISGVHYPSDVEAGCTGGTVIAAVLLQSPAFRSELAAAKAEIRASLGL